MNLLSQLKNVSRPKKAVQRVGRGPGSGRGKTSSRGEKGQGSRSGARRRYTYEGGQMRLFMKTPTRGFTRGRFAKESVIVNLCDIEKLYNDGETVSPATLVEKGYSKRKVAGGVKILSKGELKKKVSIEAHQFSEGAKQKLEKQKISYKLIKNA